MNEIQRHTTRLKAGLKTRRMYSGFVESRKTKHYNCQHQIDYELGKPTPVEWCQYCSGDAINNPRCPYYEPIENGNHKFKVGNLEK